MEQVIQFKKNLNLPLNDEELNFLLKDATICTSGIMLRLTRNGKDSFLPKVNKNKTNHSTIQYLYLIQHSYDSERLEDVIKLFDQIVENEYFVYSFKRFLKENPHLK